MKKLVALTVTCLAVVSLAACGSSSKKASTSKDTTETTTKAIGGALAGDLLTYCNTSKAASDLNSAATTAGSDLKSSLTNLKANLDTYVAAAPDEIKADVKVQVDKGLKPFIAALEKANYDISKADFSTLTAIGTDAELQAANGRITAYYTAHCKQ